MSYPEEMLIPVKSQGELKAGMTVIIKDCRGCSKTHAEILDCQLALEHYGRYCGACTTCTGWISISICLNERDQEPYCYCLAIKEGRLFRLDVSDDTEHRTSKKQPRKTTSPHR